MKEEKEKRRELPLSGRKQKFDNVYSLKTNPMWLRLKKKQNAMFVLAFSELPLFFKNHTIFKKVPAHPFSSF